MKHVTAVIVVAALTVMAPLEGMDVSISGGMMTDYMQQLGPDDESGMLTVSEVGLCFAADAGNGVSAAVGILAEEDLGSPFIEEAYVSWEPAGETGWSLTAGQTCMPFGMLNTRLISDPLILDADGIAIETILPGIVVSRQSGILEYAAAVYTEGTQAGGVLAMNLCPEHGGCTCHTGLRISSGAVLDLDAGLEWQLAEEKVIVDAELFFGVDRKEGVPQPAGCLCGISCRCCEKGQVAVRLDGVAADVEAAPAWLVAAGGSWDLPAGLTAAAEFAYEPESGARALGMQLGLCFE